MVVDTISAISTPLVASGIAVVRVSGPKSLSIAKNMFMPVGKTDVKDFTPNMMYVGKIVCDGFCDFGMCVYFKAPKSFTGEDSVEFHCHGGIAIAKGVLKKSLSLGARLATNGEFTKRAFLNGKLSLSSAEGLIDMINSESESGVRAGYYLYREKLTNEVNSMQDKLTDALAEIDADMDYPEEDLELTSHQTVEDTLNDLSTRLEVLLKSFRVGRTLKEGVKVGIVGKPNTGKSSLLNALLNYNKAIVSDIAGTTRDIVEGVLDINGVRFYFSDTAGIRESDNGIEQQGVLLSKKVLDGSDLILFVVDGGDIDGSDLAIYELVKDKNTVTVLNKIDKGVFAFDKADVSVSALKKENLDKLRELIFNKTVGSGVDLNGDFLCEERHYDALSRARDKINEALQSINKVTLDLTAIDIKDAWDALGEVSGKTATEEIIDNIFSKFCVGK